LLLSILGVTGRLNRFIYRPVDMENYWVTIPAGEFQMGSENGGDIERVHTVYLDTYRIGKYEITNRQYAQCVKARICRVVSDVGEGKELHPVVNVNWYDAKAFCGWVGGRLPTDAEWEKAASWDDGTKRKRTYPWGETINCSYVNYYSKDGRTDYCVGDTTPVGSYENGKSPYGLYDMAGNVWEWVNDWYSDTYYQSLPSSNPLGRDTGQERVLRGGAWVNFDIYVRSVVRSAINPSIAYNFFGFRCARSP
jgi:formylglycine-generating enzyme required for sulfatase activity